MSKRNTGKKGKNPKRHPANPQKPKVVPPQSSTPIVDVDKNRPASETAETCAAVQPQTVAAMPRSEGNSRHWNWKHAAAVATVLSAFSACLGVPANWFGAIGNWYARLDSKRSDERDYSLAERAFALQVETQERERRREREQLVASTPRPKEMQTKPDEIVESPPPPPRFATKLSSTKAIGTTLEQVCELSAEQLRMDAAKVVANTSLADMGADELDVIELVMELEERFDLAIPEKTVSEWNRAKKLVTMYTVASVIDSVKR